jgi:hypothetical protein
VLKTGKEIAGKLSEVCAYFFKHFHPPPHPRVSYRYTTLHLLHSQEHADIYGLKAALGYLHRIVEDSPQIGHLKATISSHKNIFIFKNMG